MPGIPSIGSESYAQFWLSFWAALYSGAVYSILTGLFVGLAVLWVQRTADRRREKSDLEREVASFRSQARAVYNDPYAVSIDSAATAMPAPCEALSTLLARGPITLWKARLAEHKRLFEFLDDFQRAYTEAVAFARKLDFELTVVVRLHNANRGAIVSNDPSRRSFFIGRILGSTPTEIMPWLNWPSNQPNLFEAEYEELAKNESLSDLVAKYLQAREFLQRTMALLHDSLVND